jgi:hypothetical protein
MTSFAVLLAPLTVGSLADATSLKAALGVVPVTLALAAVGLVLVRRAQTRMARMADGVQVGRVRPTWTPGVRPDRTDRGS